MRPRARPATSARSSPQDHSLPGAGQGGFAARRRRRPRPGTCATPISPSLLWARTAFLSSPGSFHPPRDKPFGSLLVFRARDAAGEKNTNGGRVLLARPRLPRPLRSALTQRGRRQSGAMTRPARARLSRRRGNRKCGFQRSLGGRGREDRRRRS